MTTSQDPVFRIADIAVSPKRNLLVKDSDNWRVEPLVMDLLVVLAAKPGVVLSRETLLDQLWRDGSGGDESLTRLVSQLRKVLRETGASDIVQTVPKRGYRLNAAVEPIESAKDNKPSKESGPIKDNTIPIQSARPALWRLAVVTIVTFMTVAAFLFLREPQTADNEIETVLVEDKSIAVLPFADLSKEGDQTYFADGVAEDIINVLVKNDGLHVTGRTSSFSFRGKEVDLREIGTQLGVSYILEGSVRKQEDRVRITAQLIKTADGFHVWSETYDSDLKDIFNIQDKISREIATRLKVKILSGQLVGGTTNIDAYNDYLQGVYHLRQREPESFNVAITAFERALAHDPNFADAHAARASAWRLAGLFSNTVSGEEARRESTASAERALAISTQHASAMATLGMTRILYERDWRAGELLSRAASLAPSDSEVLNTYGDYLDYIGNFAAARKVEQRAVDIDPLFVMNLTDMAFLGLFSRDYALAEEYSKRALKLEPTQYHPLWGLGIAYAQQKNISEAKKVHARLVDKQGRRDRNAIWLEVEIFIAEGRNEEAATLIEAATMTPGGGGLSSGAAGQLFAAMGHFDQAGEHLLRAYDSYDPLINFPLYVRSPEQAPESKPWQAFWDKPQMRELAALRSSFD